MSPSDRPSALTEIKAQMRDAPLIAPIAGRLGFCHEGCRARGEAFSPTASWSEIDVHEARAGIGAEAEETNRACGFGESHRIVVRHGDIKRGAQHVF